MDDEDDDVTPITRSLDDDSRFDTHQLNTPTTTTVQQRLKTVKTGGRGASVVRSLALSLSLSAPEPQHSVEGTGPTSNERALSATLLLRPGAREAETE